MLERVAAFYLQASDVEGMPADMAQLSTQVATALSQSGENSNLLGVLANTSLMHVPSLLAGGMPISERAVIEPFARLLYFLKRFAPGTTDFVFHLGRRKRIAKKMAALKEAA